MTAASGRAEGGWCEKHGGYLGRGCARCAQPAAPVLPPLDLRGILWVAAIDCKPIGERILWVEAMAERIEAINTEREERNANG